MSTARDRFTIVLRAPVTTRRAADPDELVGVPAGELSEWGRLVGGLADWLADIPDTTAAHLDRHVAGHLTRDDAAWTCLHTAERIAALLHSDRGRP